MRRQARFPGWFCFLGEFIFLALLKHLLGIGFLVAANPSPWLVHTPILFVQALLGKMNSPKQTTLLWLVGDMF